MIRELKSSRWEVYRSVDWGTETVVRSQSRVIFRLKLLQFDIFTIRG
jgi:hypothetical protein